MIKQPKWFDIHKPVQKEVEDYVVQQRLEHLNYKKGGMTDRNVSKKRSLNEMLKLDLKQIQSSQVECREKNIQTHRASRRKGSDADDEDFEELKKILQSQNMQKRLADKRQENTQPSTKTQGEDEKNRNRNELES